MLFNELLTQKLISRCAFYEDLAIAQRQFVTADAIYQSHITTKVVVELSRLTFERIMPLNLERSVSTWFNFSRPTENCQRPVKSQ